MNSPVRVPFARVAAASLATVPFLFAAAESQAAFVELYPVAVNITLDGQQLTQYTIYARFNGATDTVVSVTNLRGVNGAVLDRFYHKDNSPGSAGTLTRTGGTWSPTQTGSATLNRPYDSFLLVGGVPTATNTTVAEPSWPASGGSWNRPDIPADVGVGYYNAVPSNNQGRVATGGAPAASVRIAQFVVDQGCGVGQLDMTIRFTNGTPNAPIQTAPASIIVGAGLPLPTVWYADADLDGIGFAADGTTTACSQPTGYSAIDGDNCPNIANPKQEDVNLNSVGDVCDLARGDLNLDGVVNGFDLKILLKLWDEVNPPFGDLDGDGTVGQGDLQLLLSNWDE